MYVSVSLSPTWKLLNPVATGTLAHIGSKGLGACNQNQKVFLAEYIHKPQTTRGSAVQESN
jgi:hypothetical protein